VDTFGMHLFDTTEGDPKTTAIVRIMVQNPLDFYGEIKRFLWSFAPNPPTQNPPDAFTETIDGETFSAQFDQLITEFISHFSGDINRLISKYSIYRLVKVFPWDNYKVVIPISI
jgi:hypothetical protein